MHKNRILRKEELFESLIKEPKSNSNIASEFHIRRNQSNLISLFLKDSMAFYGLITICFISFGAIFFPYLSTYNYYKNHLSMVNCPPSSQFLFGTDDLGRDMFVRIWYGARISLGVGFGGALVDFLFGGLIGGFSGYIGGKTDEFIMRLIDVLDSVPNMIKAMALMTFLDGNFFSVMFVVALTGWINTARIIRGQVMLMKKRDFFISAKAVGASHSRILTKHILPNIVGPLLVSVTMSIPFAIFTESFLSFLGLGIELPAPSWGSMVGDGIAAMRYYPWRILFPSLFIFITILSFNFIGSGLRNAVDSNIQIHNL